LTPTYTSTPTETPTQTPTPTLTPTPVVAAVRTTGTERARLRQSPVDGAIVESLASGTEVHILSQNDDGSWFEVFVVSSGNIGWISRDLLDVAGSAQVEPVTGSGETPATPTPTVALPTPVGVIDQGTYQPGQQKIYEIVAEGNETVIILAYRSDGGVPLRLDVYADNRQRIASGSPYSQFPSNAGYGGLVWQGGQQGATIILDVVNESNRPVEFCLARREVFEWICN
jgi:hypothetical protein